MIELGKQYKTRDGREVRIYAVDEGGEFPVHGAIKKSGDIWDSMCWGVNGEWFSVADIDCYDLIGVKPRIQREVWVNVYHNKVNDQCYINSQTADEQALPNRIACVKVVIDCDEGEGL